MRNSIRWSMRKSPWSPHTSMYLGCISYVVWCRDLHGVVLIRHLEAIEQVQLKALRMFFGCMHGSITSYIASFGLNLTCSSWGVWHKGETCLILHG